MMQTSMEQLAPAPELVVACKLRPSTFSSPTVGEVRVVATVVFQEVSCATWSQMTKGRGHSYGLLRIGSRSRLGSENCHHCWEQTRSVPLTSEGRWVEGPRVKVAAV